MGFINKAGGRVLGRDETASTATKAGGLVTRVRELRAKQAERARLAAEQEQVKANEGSIQHGKIMGDIAAKAAAEGAARDLGSTPEASADVAVGGGGEDSAIDTAAGRSKRKRQVFSSGGSSGVNI